MIRRNANNVQFSLCTEFTTRSTMTHNNPRHALQYESGCKHKGMHAHRKYERGNAEEAQNIRVMSTNNQCNQD